jgi:glycogen(starch) synthase
MNRILIVSWEYPPLIEGGLARHVRKLSEALVELGIEVHVLTRGGEQATIEEQTGGVQIHRIVEPERPTDLAQFVTWVERMNSDMLAAGVDLGDRYDFDLVHGHDWLVAGACDHLARRYGTPLVTTIHATEFGRHQGWVEKHPQAHIHGVEKWISNRSDRVIACSLFMKDQIGEIFSVEPDRVTVIPNGIDPGDMPPEDPVALAALRAEFAEPDENLVLLIGRLVYEKGFQLALEAMPEVIRQVPNTRFLVAGSGTHEAELHKQAEDLGLMDHGFFLGWIGDDVLHSLYRISDLTVVPSIYEPFGLVALEAMASECPCIAADTGGLREVVPLEGAGLRFRASDPGHLAEAAVQVLSDEDLSRRMVEEGLSHIRLFDWADVARQTLDLYGEVIAVADPS